MDFGYCLSYLVGVAKKGEKSYNNRYLGLAFFLFYLYMGDALKVQDISPNEITYDMLIEVLAMDGKQYLYKICI